MAKDEIEISQLDSTPEDKQAIEGSKKKAARIRELWVNTNTGKRQLWRSNEQVSLEFFHNVQLTDDEQDALKSAGMPTFIINRVTPVIETLKYFITANNPRWQAVGAEGADTDMGHVLSSLIDYSWYVSNGRVLLGQVIQDVLTKSKGYLHIVVDPNADRGLGEVVFQHVDSFDVYTATMSRDIFERDSAYSMIKKDMPKADLLRMLPDFEDKIRRAQGQEESAGYSDRDTEESFVIYPDDVETQRESETAYEDEIIQYYELYEPMQVKFYNLIIKIEPAESELEEAKAAIDKAVEDLAQELQVQAIEKEAELRQMLEQGEIVRERYELEVQKAFESIQSKVQEQKAIMYQRVKEEAERVEEKVVTEDEYKKLKRTEGDLIVKAHPFFETRIKRSCAVGDQLLYEYMMNIPFCPLIPLPYTHTGTPFPMSAVYPLIGKQQEINKSHQIMVHNANLSSNLRWLYVLGEIDEDEWEDYSSSSGALLSYRPGFSPEGPRPILPQPINNAFFTIEQDSKSDLEYMAGVFPGMMGAMQKSDEPYRGLLARDEFGTRRIRSWITNVMEPWLEYVGKVYLELARSTYKAHKVFRIVQPNPGGGFETREIEVNLPLYDDLQEEIGRFHDLSTARYDIRVVAGSTLPINRWAVREEYKEYFELGLIDDIAFVQETDIKNKEALLKRKSMYADMRSQLNQLEEAVKDKDGTIETLSRQLVQAGIKDQVQKASMEIDRTKTETKMMDKLVQERFRDSLKQLREELKLEIQKAVIAAKEAEKKVKENKVSK
jgi:hypothetical protein